MGEELQRLHVNVETRGAAGWVRRLQAGTHGVARGCRGALQRLPLPLAQHGNDLPTSPYISLCLPTSPHIPTPPYISLHLPISPYISLHLPISPYICLFLACHSASLASAAMRLLTPTLTLTLTLTLTPTLTLTLTLAVWLLHDEHEAGEGARGQLRKRGLCLG